MSAPDLNARVYQAEVSHRLEHVESYLSNFRLGIYAPVMVALWSLRALQDESRQAGRSDLSELCHRMERGILKLQMTHHEDGEDLVAEIAGTMGYVRREARTACYGPETACVPEKAGDASTEKQPLRLVPVAI